MMKLIVKTLIIAGSISGAAVIAHDYKLKRDRERLLDQLAQDRIEYVQRWNETAQNIRIQDESIKQMTSKSTDRIRVSLENLAREDPRWIPFLDQWNKM